MQGFDVACVLCRMGIVVLDCLQIHCGCIISSGICPMCRTSMTMAAIRDGCASTHHAEVE